MSEDFDSFKEQISTFIDDEMSVEESEFFVRRLQREPDARQQYLRYQLIGAAVRGEYLHPAAADLGRRLEEAIDRDDVPAVRSWSRWVSFAGGAGIAASVAVVAIFGLRLAYLGPEQALPGTGEMLDVADAAAPSYVVPASNASFQPLVGAEVTGIQYLMHHARYTSGVSRTIMQSSVVAGQETDLTEETGDDTVE